MRTFSVAGTAARMRAASSMGATGWAGFDSAATLMLSYAPGSPATYCAWLGISSATVVPPRDSLPANFVMPAIV